MNEPPLSGIRFGPLYAPFVSVCRRETSARGPTHLGEQNGRDAGFLETVDAELATETLASSGLFWPDFTSLQRRFRLFVSAEIPRICATLDERASERR